jgi:hypothetical protein
MRGNNRVGLSAGSRDGLKEDDIKLLRAFYQALVPFERIRHDMPMQYVRTFMLVCMKPGLGVNEYASRAGVSQTVMSRPQASADWCNAPHVALP